MFCFIVREKFDQVPSNTTAKTQNMLFGTPSPFSVPLKKFDSEKPSVTSIALPQSTSIEGSSTITYGGPETPVAQKKQIPKFDVNSQTEASSNLNNPPRVTLVVLVAVTTFHMFKGQLQKLLVLLFFREETLRLVLGLTFSINLL